jgi:hypothetical protein
VLVGYNQLLTFLIWFFIVESVKHTKCQSSELEKHIKIKFANYLLLYETQKEIGNLCELFEKPANYEK